MYNYKFTYYISFIKKIDIYIYKNIFNNIDINNDNIKYL